MAVAQSHFLEIVPSGPLGKNEIANPASPMLNWNQPILNQIKTIDFSDRTFTEVKQAAKTQQLQPKSGTPPPPNNEHVVSFSIREGGPSIRGPDYDQTTQFQPVESVGFDLGQP